MIHPSYTELIDVVNSEAEDEQPVIQSRYSIVIATAKRARQLVAGAPTGVENSSNQKPLSIAVEELWHKDLRIVGEDDISEDEIEV
ncbi:DNA-directed RNA polymerase subunit omega [Cuneatibacter caecimuris]|uniref:DNA-directed RNA polymerase subunit omega n=1 Tax=Cuneatibacter caecimuris TaxID=1796618 RepID=A0A4Q7NZT1_9FIRM|nr:DNA-directed RNA polymerase subunit omega [Cuneatibacter caecimuris]RZS92874.1 DNA-directed RNA polymerase subunit omega [Cuneatibacter caecimuris]